MDFKGSVDDVDSILPPMAPGRTCFVLNKQPEILSLFSSQAFLCGQIALYVPESIGQILRLVICNAENLQKLFFYMDALIP